MTEQQYTREELGLPYTTIEADYGSFLILGHNGRAGTANSEELARFIITAANCHHDLLEALEELMDSDTVRDAIERMKMDGKVASAILKARGD